MTDSTPLELNLTLGVLLVTLVFTSILFGVSCAQTGYYYKQCVQDRCLLKCMVAVIWALDATYQVFFICTMYSYLAKKSGLAPENEFTIWTSDVQVISNVAVMALIQSFYTSKIWRLSNNNIPLIVILTTFIAGSLITAFVLFVKILRATTLQELRRLDKFGIALNVLTSSTVILITASFCTLLLRSKNGSKRGNFLISKLLRFCINTGILTTICAALSIITILVLPNTYIYILFFYLGGRLYSISLVATLNARQGLRKQVNSMHMPSDPDPESVRVSRESQRSGQCLTDEIYVDMDYDSEMRPERLSAVSRLEDASTGFGQTVRHSKAADPDV